MQKIFLVLASVLLFSSSQAQTDTLGFYQFNDGLMPAGFTLINKDGLTPDDPELVTLTDSAWAIRNITSQGWTSGYSAFTVSWYKNDAGPSNDWLVLPKMTFSAGMRMSWSALAITSSGNYRDQYRVFGANGKTYEDFGNYAPIFDTSDDGEFAVPTDRSLNLDSLLKLQGFNYGDSVFLAFVDVTKPLYGNELAIDNILVTANSASAIESGVAVVLEVANPARNGQIEAAFSLTQPQTVTYSLVSTNGAVVAAGSLRANTNGNRLTVAAPAAAGLYTLVLTGETFSTSAKVVVE